MKEENGYLNVTNLKHRSVPAWLLAYSKYQTLLSHCHLVKLYDQTELHVYLHQTRF